MNHLHRLAGRVFNTPLAIAPDKAAVIAAVITSRLAGVAVEASAGGDNRRDAVELEVSSDGVARIDICGTLVEKSSWLDAASGLLAYDTISEQLLEADADSRVKGILLIVDSPGGEVTGMFGCAKVLGAVAKPVFAIASHCACSAAYLLAAQSDRLYVTEDSVVGSIGVIAQHMEMSGADAERGLKYTTIYAGARKNDGNPHEPLSKGAHAAIKADVDEVMNKFVGSVSASRGLSEDAVRATEAGIFRGESAITAGLADALGTPADALLALVDRISNPSSVAAATRQAQEALVMSKPVAGPPLAAKTEKVPELADAGTGADATAKQEAAGSPEVVPPEEKKKDPGEEDATLTGAACREIADLCAIAGRPALVGAFIQQQVPVAKVRSALINAQADESPAILSAIDPSVGAKPKAFNPNDPNENALLADAQKRRAAAEGQKGAR